MLNQTATERKSFRITPPYLNLFLLFILRGEIHYRVTVVSYWGRHLLKGDSIQQIPNEWDKSLTNYACTFSGFSLSSCMLIEKEGYLWKKRLELENNLPSELKLVTDDVPTFLFTTCAIKILTATKCAP